MPAGWSKGEGDPMWRGLEEVVEGVQERRATRAIVDSREERCACGAAVHSSTSRCIREGRRRIGTPDPSA